MASYKSFSIIYQSLEYQSMDTFFQFKLIEFDKRLAGKPPLSYKPVYGLVLLVTNIDVISFNDIQYYMY